MPFNPLKTSLTILCLSLLMGCASQQEEKLGQDFVAPDYSGYWEIDYKLTEDPQEKLLYLYEIARSHAEQRQAAQEGNRGQTSGYDVERALNNLRGVIQLGTLAESITRAPFIVIEQEKDFMMVHRNGDFTLSCDFIQRQLPLALETCGYDANGQMVFIAQLPEGLTVVNRLVLAENGKRLNIATTVMSEKFGSPFTLNKVYRPFEPGEELFDCEFTLAKKKTCWLGHGEETQ